MLPTTPFSWELHFTGPKVSLGICIFRKLWCRHLPRVGVIILGLCSDPSQSDPETKDFWLNMATLTETLQRQAEQNPAASYYNVVLLRYQVGQVDGVGQSGHRQGWGGAG